MHKKKSSKKKTKNINKNPVKANPPAENTTSRAAAWKEGLFGLILFCAISVYIEICLHYCIFGSFGKRIIYPAMFACDFGAFCLLVTGVLPRIPRRILATILVVAQVFYAEVQVVYHQVFGNLMALNMVTMGGGVLTNFGAQILHGMSEVIVPILLLLLPLVVYIVLVVLKARKKIYTRLRWKQNLAAFAILVAGLCATFGLLVMKPKVYNIFNDVSTSTDTSYKNVGMIGTIGQELRYMILGVEYSAGFVDGTIGVGVSGTVYSAEEYNVDATLDFTALAKSTEDEALQAIDEYLATIIPTEKNEYTGMFEGYNLITICAEAFSSYLIDEELTPMLYEMSTNGIVFENYYGTFKSVTTNGEYTMCMGLFPDMSRTKVDSSFDLSSTHYLPYCLGNALGSLDYLTYAYHNYWSDFYNRIYTHTNMGYTFKTPDNGLDMEMTWPSSDLDMMVCSVEDFIDSGESFHAYYMTFSGHYQYDWDNAMSLKNQDAVSDLDYSETVQAYIACNLELEYALEYLMERLEEAGIADKTVIVLTNDHYPYGLAEEYYNELAGEEIDTTYGIYKNSFICYCAGMEESIIVEDYCCTVDILPTLLNLFGVEYDSRLLAGTDVLSSSTHVAILSDQSFLTEGFRYDASTGTLTITDPSITVDEATLNDYIAYVANKFVLSTQILDNDFYAYVFGVESSSAEDDESVITFTDLTSGVNIFQQSNVLRMYRKGFVDAEGEDYFGGKSDCLLGEFVDVLYRITDYPDITDDALPEGYMDGEFTSESDYYDAVCWAYEIGLIHDDDTYLRSDECIDRETAARIILRYAIWYGLDVTVDSDTLESCMELYTDIEEETIVAFIWCVENSVMQDMEVEEMAELRTQSLNRFKMVNFLCYLYSYPMGM